MSKQESSDDVQKFIDFVFEDGVWKIKYKNQQITYPCSPITKED